MVNVEEDTTWLDGWMDGEDAVKVSESSNSRYWPSRHMVFRSTQLNKTIDLMNSDPQILDHRYPPIF